MISSENYLDIKLSGYHNTCTIYQSPIFVIHLFKQFQPFSHPDGVNMHIFPMRRLINTIHHLNGGGTQPNGTKAITKFCNHQIGGKKTTAMFNQLLSNLSSSFMKSIPAKY